MTPLADTALASEPLRFGKYRGKVEDNIDPLGRGRLKVSVPILGDGRLVWAEPCVPYAGPGVGLFSVPPAQANVWVEFEGGRTSAPIWSGCFWGQGEMTALGVMTGLEAMTHVHKRTGFTLTVAESGATQGVTIEVTPPVVPTPVKLVCNATGIELTCGANKIAVTTAGIELSNGSGKVAVTSASVSINNGALEVT